MSSQDKMLELLDKFTVERPVWSADELIALSGLPVSTCYRGLKSLHQAGLLARVGSGSYVIGPRALALDRVSRLSDPVYIVGTPVIRKLSTATGYSALLSVLYSGSVMCVQQEATAQCPPGLFGRGQQRPIVGGATANVILAHLPAHQLRTVYARNSEAVAAAGLGSDWTVFRQRLRDIRNRGFVSSRGEFRPGIAGLAAPLFNRAGEVLGSIALATDARAESLDSFIALAPLVVEAAANISRGIAANLEMLDLPARSPG